MNKTLVSGEGAAAAHVALAWIAPSLPNQVRIELHPLQVFLLTVGAGDTIGTTFTLGFYIY